MRKGTRVIINLWSLHHDEKEWKNPELFDPGENLLLFYASYFIQEKVLLDSKKNMINDDIKEEPISDRSLTPQLLWT